MTRCQLANEEKSSAEYCIIKKKNKRIKIAMRTRSSVSQPCAQTAAAHASVLAILFRTHRMLQPVFSLCHNKNIPRMRHSVEFLQWLDRRCAPCSLQKFWCGMGFCQRWPWAGMTCPQPDFEHSLHKSLCEDQRAAGTAHDFDQ